MCFLIQLSVSSMYVTLTPLKYCIMLLGFNKM
jgi:hypothetical protein